MHIIELYNSIFNYEIHSSFAAFLRIATCGYITLFIGHILQDALLFSDPDKNSIFSGNNYKIFCQTKYQQISLFDMFIDSKSFQKFIFISFFIFGFFSIIGFITNLSILLFAICFISIQSRIFPIIFSTGDTVSRVLLLSLLLTDCGSKYSLDNILNISSNKDRIDGLGILITQITIPFGYFMSATYKLQDHFWANGEAFRNAIVSKLWGRRILLQLVNYPFIYKSINYYIVLFELLSPILFLIKEFRPIAIVSAILLHMGILIWMRIDFFGMIMMISILYFMNDYFV